MVPGDARSEAGGDELRVGALEEAGGDELRVGALEEESTNRAAKQGSRE